MTPPPFPPLFLAPLDLRRYGPRGRLARQLSEPAEPPLRARSVCLARRPQSGRELRERPQSERYAYSQKQFHLRERTSSEVAQVAPAPKVPRRKSPPRRVPCAVSIKNLSIPIVCDSDAAHTPPDAKRSRRSKTNPRKQAGPARAARARDTDNRLLIQISEADQVSDFERILGSNAILCERRAAGGARGAGERPRSGYSVARVSEAYHRLFQCHIDSVQGLIRDYRAGADVAAERAPPDSFLTRRADEPLDLSEFYDDDRSLQEELVAAADRLLDEEVRQVEEQEEPPERAARNFNVNLSSLIVEPGSPAPYDSDDEKEWDAAMSARSGERGRGDSVATLARDLAGVRLEKDAGVPTITFSDCCDDNARRDTAAQSVAVNLTVPAVERRVEARPAT